MAEKSKSQLIQKIKYIILEILKCQRVTIFKVDINLSQLRAINATDMGFFKLPIHKGIVGYCAEIGKTINLQDAYKHQRFNKQIDKASGYLTKSMICLPLFNPLGNVDIILQAINKKQKPFYFSQLDQYLLKMIGQTIKYCLDQCFITQQDASDNRFYYPLTLVLVQVSRKKILVEILNQVQDSLTEHFGFNETKVVLIKQSNKIVFFDRNDRNKKLLDRLRTLQKDGFVRKAEQVHRRNEKNFIGNVSQLIIANSNQSCYFNEIIDVNTNFPLCIFPMLNHRSGLWGIIQFVSFKSYQKQDSQWILKKKVVQALQFLSIILSNLIDKVSMSDIY